MGTATFLLLILPCFALGSPAFDAARNAKAKAMNEYSVRSNANPKMSPEARKQLYQDTVGKAELGVRNAARNERINFSSKLGREMKANNQRALELRKNKPGAATGKNPRPDFEPVKRPETVIDGSKVKQEIEFKKPATEEPAPVNTVEPGIHGR